ncbi:MAG: (2Fe-2S) ferredoxin domain-containing protein [Alphaproteobacteria bacterium]|nr:(2Fe-2S) ferredoxin domain-containing protein [Alphaproteobacteria bacterium]MBF0129691.1 (2Fe-2S) ferredoxin domain-containing protein [Alphaproteobacteria bacterium]
MSEGLAQVVKYHVFCCTTERPPTHPRPSCGGRGSGELINYLWEKVMGLELADVRAGTASCLGACNAGPVMVVYPEGAWYHFENKVDIDEIIQSHFIDGKIVDRLLLNRA